ncbi:MAG: hypothetical protein Q8834_02995, partial [Candidatus Phytoplasma australasiaticum]|nr:hypothetical protein [Candidatus Phytoplasma australasiaticum]
MFTTIDKVAYELDLPIYINMIYPGFHVSMLRKCLCDPSAILPLDVVGVVEDNLTYEEIPVEILDRQCVKKHNFCTPKLSITG